MRVRSPIASRQAALARPLLRAPSELDGDAVDERSIQSLRLIATQRSSLMQKTGLGRMTMVFTPSARLGRPNSAAPEEEVAGVELFSPLTSGPARVRVSRSAMSQVSHPSGFPLSLLYPPS